MDDLKRRIDKVEEEIKNQMQQMHDINNRLIRTEFHVDTILNTMREIRDDTKFTKRTIVKTIFGIVASVIIALMTALLNL